MDLAILGQDSSSAPIQAKLQKIKTTSQATAQAQPKTQTSKPAQTDTSKDKKSKIIDESDEEEINAMSDGMPEGSDSDDLPDDLGDSDD